MYENITHVIFSSADELKDTQIMLKIKKDRAYRIIVIV